MNRKDNKQKETKGRIDPSDIRYIEPVAPKFSPNWTQNIRLDKIIINICDCQYEVLPRVAKQLKWKIKKDQNCPDWDVWWTDWHVQAQTLLKMQHHQKINHFPGMFNLSRKNLLAKNLMKMRKKSTDDYNFFPLTWNLPLQFNEFRTYFQSKPKGKSRTYIVKPQSMSQGKGIFLTKKIQQIPLDQRSVVQRYISRPYLIDGLKFDLRIYVLVAGVDPLRLFVYHEGLARFATETYVVPNKDNMQQICMHLTNYAINKESEKFVFNEDEKDMTVGHKRSLTCILTLLQEKGVNIVQLKNKINQLIVKTIISGLSHLKFQYRSCQRDNYRGDMCFEILGFDILLNEDLQPFLLEINYTPSFSTDTPLDESIKKNLIKDTLILMEVNKKFKQKTVNERKEIKNSRMMTGKKQKISNQERQQKIKQAVKQRDQYISKNLGGFTQIFPPTPQTPQNTTLLQNYNRLINLQSDYLDYGKKKQTQKQKDNKGSSKKVQKLPLLSTAKDQNKRSSKAKYSCKLFQQSRRQSTNNTDLSLNNKITHISSSQNSNKQLISIHELSQKALRKVRTRQVHMPRKKTQQREALTLKAIQFEGTKFDGICDNFRQQLLRNRQ